MTVGPGEVLCVGIGSPQGDDQAGWLVIDALQNLSRQRVCLRKAAYPGELLDWLEPRGTLWIVDACRGGGKPGDWNCWHWPTEELPASLSRGTHDLGLAAVLQWGAALGRMPEEVLFWGIRIDSAVVGGQPTGPTLRAVAEVAAEMSRLWTQADANSGT
ncbi:MAG: hydrogenase maturation protease [Planctomycetaceae bacterium]